MAESETTKRAAEFGTGGVFAPVHSSAGLITEAVTCLGCGTTLNRHFIKDWSRCPVCEAKAAGEAKDGKARPFTVVVARAGTAYDVDSQEVLHLEASNVGELLQHFNGGPRNDVEPVAVFEGRVKPIWVASPLTWPIPRVR